MTYPSPTECPRCGEIAVVSIVRGMPGGDLVARARRGEIILGGCVVSDPLDMPKVGCTACNWREATVSDFLEEMIVATRNQRRPHSTRDSDESDQPA